MRWAATARLSKLGPKEGLWFDHEQGRGGDVVEFIRIECGCSFQEALDYAASFVPGLRYGDGAPRRPERPAPRIISDKNDDAGDERKIERALTIWSQTVSLRGTPAEGYLRSRAIEVPDEALDVLRFHPACPWEDSRRPALVVLIRDVVTDEPAAIHRTALTADGCKIERRALGSKGGGAIKLTPDAGITGELPQENPHAR
jgi:putative DNA primase/helicase